MEGEFIIIALISTVGGLAGLILINHNWFKRQEIKYKYDIKRYRLKKNFNLSSSLPQIGTPSTEPSLKSAAIGSILKSIPPEQLEGLIEKFLPEAAEGEGESSPLEALIAYGLSEEGKPLRDMFIKGLSEKTGNKEGGSSY